jgi:hypothetical protein
MPIAIAVVGVASYYATRLCKWRRPTAHEDGLFLLFIVSWVIVGGAAEWRPHTSRWYTDFGILIGGGLLAAILGSRFWLAFDLPSRNQILTWASGKLNWNAPS